MMLTATTEIGTDIFGLQDVVSGYIRKPFNNTELSDKAARRYWRTQPRSLLRAGS